MAQKLDANGPINRDNSRLVLRHEGRILATSDQFRILHNGGGRWICGRIKVAGIPEANIALETTVDKKKPAYRTLKEVRQTSSEPFDVVLVLDRSHSMRKNDPDNLRKEAVRRFYQMAQTSPQIRSLGIVVFHSRAQTILPPTPPKQIRDIQPYLDKLNPYGSTAYDPPLILADRMLESQAGNRQAVLFLSDGEPRRRYRNEHKRFVKKKCPVYTVGLTEDADEELLKKIARKTGGKFFDAPSAAALERHFSRIFQMIARPRLILKETAALPGKNTFPFWIDPTMRNPVLTLAPISGSVSAAVNNAAARELDINALTFHPLEELAPGRHLIHFKGNGRLTLTVRAETDIAIETMPLLPDAQTQSPLRFAFFLAGGEQLTEVSAICTLTDTAGNRVPHRIDRTGFGLYTVHAPQAGSGRFTANLEVEGKLGRHRVVRKRTISFERQAQNIPETAASRPAVTGAAKNDADPDSRPLVIAPAGTTTVAKGNLTATFRASPDHIEITGIYPGGEAKRRSLTVVLNAPDPAVSQKPVFVPSPPPGLKIGIKGKFRPERRSKLTISAQAEPGAAGQQYDGTLVFGGNDTWQVPVTVKAAVPVIDAVMTPIETSREGRRLIVENHLKVNLSPSGRCPVLAGSEVEGLKITPARLEVGSKPQNFTLHLKAPIPQDGLHKQGVVQLTGPGLEPVSVPYEVEVAAAAPVSTAATPHPRFPLWWILAMAAVAVLLIFLLQASLRGSRRAFFLMVSVAVHAVILFVALPESRLEKEKRSGPVTMRIKAGRVVVEEQIPTEKVEKMTTDLDSSPAKSSEQKQEAVPEPEQTEQSRELQAQENKMAKAEAEAAKPQHRIKKEPLRTAEIKAAPPEQIERRHQEKMRAQEDPNATRDKRLKSSAAAAPEESRTVETHDSGNAVQEQGEAAVIESDLTRSTIRLRRLPAPPGKNIVRKKQTDKDRSPREPVRFRHPAKATSPADGAPGDEIAAVVDVGAPLTHVPITHDTALAPRGKLPRSTTLSTDSAKEISRPSRRIAKHRDEGPENPSATPRRYAAAHIKTVSAGNGAKFERPDSSKMAVTSSTASATVQAAGGALDDDEFKVARAFPELADVPLYENAVTAGRKQSPATTPSASAPVAMRHAGVDERTTDPAPGESDRPARRRMSVSRGQGKARPISSSRAGKEPRAVTRRKTRFANLSSTPKDVAKSKAESRTPRGPSASNPASSTVTTKAVQSLANPQEEMAKKLDIRAATARAVTARGDNQDTPVLPPSPGDAKGAGSRWRNTFPNLKHGGDWDCDRTAMLNLAHEFERRTGSAIPYESRNVEVANANLQQAPFLFMSGHQNFAFSRQERRKLKKYLTNGGYLWINDSTDIGEETYDQAVRREMSRLLPESEWKKIPMDHPIFQGPYDLTGGYKGYHVPPGDKYRQDYLEGLWIGDRLTVIYTRNDYGDGLEIDARTNPLMQSLTDLSPDEMQESSVRMGTNIAMYCINRGSPAEVNFVADSAETNGKSGGADPAGRNAKNVNWVEPPNAWRTPGNWGDHIILSNVRRSIKDTMLELEFSAGDSFRRRKDQVTVGRILNGKDVTGETIVMLDVVNKMQGGARLALGFKKNEGDYYETAPIFIKPGVNPDLVFDLKDITVKCATSNWKYNARLPDGFRANNIYLILFPHQSQGRIAFGNFRKIE